MPSTGPKKARLYIGNEIMKKRQCKKELKKKTCLMCVNLKFGEPDEFDYGDIWCAKDNWVGEKKYADIFKINKCKYFNLNIPEEVKDFNETF